MFRRFNFYAVVTILFIGTLYTIGCGDGTDDPPDGLSDGVDEPVTVVLPFDEDGGPPIFDVMAARRSVRSFTDTPLTEREIGRLLWAGQGVTDRSRGLRTTPSAGALYPVTLYVSDAAGVRRYLPETGSLAEVSRDDVRRTLAAAAYGQPAVRAAPTVIIITVCPEITAVKYGDRAERYCVLEAGHVAQNVLLAAVALGLGAVTIGAFDDESVGSALGLTYGYVPLYLIPVGHTE